VKNRCDQPTAAPDERVRKPWLLVAMSRHSVCRTRQIGGVQNESQTRAPWRRRQRRAAKDVRWRSAAESPAAPRACDARGPATQWVRPARWGDQMGARGAYAGAASGVDPAGHGPSAAGGHMPRHGVRIQPATRAEPRERAHMLSPRARLRTRCARTEVAGASACWRQCFARIAPSVQGRPQYERLAAALCAGESGRETEVGGLPHARTRSDLRVRRASRRGQRPRQEA
jgi:hypothetical protein